ncbi:transposase [uncultured Tateyamaria sp.]|uniref:REP-associated tyrosine transposase n=1 Tax=uncultured Tateyamaria sp. TaxID=455651 RepID=UPI00260F8828|nr:transposase [uncultured Tateyamaria sp.]
MSTYRRLRVPGATYFFTLALADRRNDHLVRHICALRKAYAATCAEHPFETRAIVVLPDHLHAVWALPPGDSDFPERWRKIKARFSNAVGGDFPRSPSKMAKRECGLWQRRYWEHMIRDEADYRAHVGYCWFNPVKHGVVERPTDWLHSSIHRDMRRDLVDLAWCDLPRKIEVGE